MRALADVCWVSCATSRGATALVSCNRADPLGLSWLHALTFGCLACVLCVMRGGGCLRCRRG